MTERCTDQNIYTWTHLCFYEIHAEPEHNICQSSVSGTN